MDFELSQSFTIESARFLPHLPQEHPCSRIHGHSFLIRLIIRGPVDQKIGWVMDYSDIQKAMEPILKLTDHQQLNKVQGLENPTTETLCQWIYNKLKNQLPLLHQVEIKETATTSCVYPIPRANSDPSRQSL